MENIKILDCTLRDGGYVNDWNFSNEEIINIVEKVKNARIDYIEVGFLDCNCKKQSGTRFISQKRVDELFSGYQNLIAMVMVGEYSSKDLVDLKNGESAISCIRICFKKEKIFEAVDFSKEAIAKGYEICFQPASILDYSADEFKIVIQYANELKIKALYIVDTYGMMTKDDVRNYYKLVDVLLDKEIALGFHSHNNLQLSFSNAQILLEYKMKREIIIDATIYGMGRGAGNLCTELIVSYLNDNFEKQYDTIPVLEIVDEYITNYYKKNPWGYSVAYYVAARNNCHPNYATYLTNTLRLGVKDVNTLLAKIEEAKKRNYDEPYIRKIYIESISLLSEVDFKEQVLKELVNNRIVLLLANGNSIIQYKDEILEFIRENNPVVMSVNYIDDVLGAEMSFFANIKRFKRAREKFSDEKLIFVASNLKKHIEESENVLYLDYKTIIDEEYSAYDNSGMMAIRAVARLGAEQIYLAGFDGFKIDSSDWNYQNQNDNVFEFEDICMLNDNIRCQIEKLKKKIKISFLTPSIYCEYE